MKLIEKEYFYNERKIKLRVIFDRKEEREGVVEFVWFKTV